jgi:hypothetical protein
MLTREIKPFIESQFRILPGARKPESPVHRSAGYDTWVKFGKYSAGRRAVAFDVVEPARIVNYVARARRTKAAHVARRRHQKRARD